MNGEKIKELEKVINTECKNTAGVVVYENGEKTFEEYFNGCKPKDNIHVFSVTKSVISALIGIAIEKGCIKSVKQSVLDFFPDYTLKRGEKTLQNVTLEDMLCMRAPYKYRYAPYTKYFTSEDWVKASLDLLGGKGQIGEFRYAPLIGPDIFSGILTNSTGCSVADFAYENLFLPLSIEKKNSFCFENKDSQLAWYKKKEYPSQWICDPKGTNTAGWGLTLTTGEMAKIGLLYLNRGVWNGKRLVPEKWIDESTRVHSRWEEANLNYGYLWWITGKDSYAAIGDGGNVIYVNVKKNAVVSVASFFKPRVTDRIELIEKYILD